MAETDKLQSSERKSRAILARPSANGAAADQVCFFFLIFFFGIQIFCASIILLFLLCCPDMLTWMLSREFHLLPITIDLLHLVMCKSMCVCIHVYSHFQEGLGSS